VNLEKIVSSSCRRKIVKYLLTVSSSNIMELVRKTNSTYNQVNSNLLILKSEGILKEERFGGFRKIQLNKENPRTIVILHVLKILAFAEEQNESKDKENVLLIIKRNEINDVWLPFARGTGESTLFSINQQRDLKKLSLRTKT
jgi:hypothetical protein